MVLNSGCWRCCHERARDHDQGRHHGGAEATVSEIASLLARIQRRAGVVEDNRVVGIVSQTHLGHRSETGTEKKRKWWLDVFADTDVKAREYIKSHGAKAEDVMSRVVLG